MSDPHKPFAGPLPPLPSASTPLPSIHYVEGPFYSALHQAWDTTATTSSKSPFSDELRAAIDKAEEKTKVNLPGRSRSYHDEQLNKMEEVGEYLLWTSLMLERLTAEFVEGRYLSDTISELRKRLWEDDLSTMTVNASVSKLRKMKEETQRHAEEMKRIWLPSNYGPPLETERTQLKFRQSAYSYPNKDPRSYRDSMMSETSTAGPRTHESPADLGDSDGTNETDSETEDWFNKTIETQLNKRGKGEWRCVRGLKCKQGGVVDGVVRVFERHSEFKTHCRKHSKPFRCELPNCPKFPNGRKFGRKDGLERHQKTLHRQDIGKQNRRQTTTSSSSVASPMTPGPPSGSFYLATEMEGIQR